MNIFVFDYCSGNFFNKQDSCLVLENYQFYTPDFVSEITFSPAIVIKINKSGKYIKPDFASRYYSIYGTAINIYAQNFINDANENPLFFFKSSLLDKSTFLKKAEVTITDFFENRNPNLIPDFNLKISQLSKFSSLKSGDLILFEIIERIKVTSPGKITYISEGLEFPEVNIE